MKPEIYLGDDSQGIWLKFDKDGLWVAGQYRGQEIPHKCVLWPRFDDARLESEKDPDAPTLYEKYRDDRQWTSRQPDTKSFLLAVNELFRGPQFKVAGRRLKSAEYDDGDEHLVLTYKDGVLWDFGPLSGQVAQAWEAAFRRFEDNLDKIKGQVAEIDSRKTCFKRLLEWFKQSLLWVKRRFSTGK
jgi:hypothetical protein